MPIIRSWGVLGRASLAVIGSSASSADTRNSSRSCRAWLAWACVLCACGEAHEGPDAGPDGSGEPALAELLASLPRASDGRALWFSVELGDQRVEAVLDPTLDDAVTRWARCLDVAVACADADDTKASACIQALPRCASEAGGEGCCPGPCLDRFEAAVASGERVERALEGSLLARDCVAGLPVAP